MIPAVGLIAAMEIASPAFPPDGEIPSRFTCDGANVSPPLSWKGIPEGTRALALVVSDPDAPDPKAPKTTWTHWVLYNIPGDASGLAEDEARSELPTGTLQGLNDWKRTGYGGPCPPIGRHRYVHKLYALDTRLPDLGNPTKPRLLEAMKGHVLAEARLVGTYQKGQS